MLMEAPSFRILATIRSAARNSAIWCITFAAETSFASCCWRVRMPTSTPSPWALSRTMRQTSPAIPAVNQAVAIEYPKLRLKFGNSVRYAQDHTAHLKTEFGFDMVQVAKNRYASQQYHDFIGFQVSKPLLERVFPVVYGVELKDVLSHEDLAIGSYRYSVSRLIPQMTQVALRTHKKDMMRETPGFAKQKFLYRLSRSEYEKEWGKDYPKPGFGTRVLSALLHYMPKIGPFKAMAFNNPTPQTEEMYFKSINSTVDQYRILLKEVAHGFAPAAEL